MNPKTLLWIMWFLMFVACFACGMSALFNEGIMAIFMAICAVALGLAILPISKLARRF
jgi:hypothetical protein